MKRLSKRETACQQRSRRVGNLSLPNFEGVFRGMDIMTRNLMKEKVFVVRKKMRAEMKGAMEVATGRATERVLESLQPLIKTVMKEEMKGAMKTAMRVMKREMELAMEPAIEQVKKQEMKPAMERVKKQEMEPTMEPPKKRAKKRAMEPVKILEMEPAMEQAKKQEMEPAIEQAMEQVMEPTVSTQDAPADQNLNQRTSLDHQIMKSAERELQLQFSNKKLPDKIYTNEDIKDDSDRSVEIKLINTFSGKIVEEGPLSSMEIEIHVLDGDFGSDGQENWTKQFNAKIVNQRKDKGPLVKGKQNIRLTDGVGTIQDLRFSDNSSWIKCKKFRLGARVLQSTGNMGQVRINEAITEAFAVRDHRAKNYKKHDFPSLDDDVWHLKKITRNGKLHTLLNCKEIRTIRDFKNMWKTNPDELRKILKDCSDPDWDVIVKHASTVANDESPVLHQGCSTGMQNAYNHASSSHGHKGGFSPAEEIAPNLASQRMATSTGNPVNAQWVQSISSFHPPTNGVSGWSSSQSNEHSFQCSPNNNPVMTQSSQFNHRPHPHIPAAHACNAYSNPVLSRWEAGACNSLTTGPLPHKYTGPNQASSQNNNRLYPQFSGVHYSSYASVANSYNSPATGLPHPQYTNPNQGHASSSQNMSALLQGKVQTLTSQPPVMSTHSLNNGLGDQTSPFIYLMTGYSENNDGLLEQKTVMTPDVNIFDELPPR